MKLTAHERKIVSRINKGEIWDIPSYLRSFGKGRDQAYDMDAIRSKFADDENGKKYKVMKDGKSLLTTTHSAMEIMGQTVYTPLPILRNESDIADDEWTLREAELDDKIPTSTFNLHSAAPNGSWCGVQRQLSAANGIPKSGCR